MPCPKRLAHIYCQSKTASQRLVTQDATRDIPTRWSLLRGKMVAFFSELSLQLCGLNNTARMLIPLHS
jgi:hypothetical protein